FHEKEDRCDNGGGVTLSRERQEMRGMLGAIAAWSEVADVRICLNLCLIIKKMLEYCISGQGRKLTAESVSGEVDERKACTERTKGSSSYNHKYHV
ncbi:hypothetical protein ALC60_03608, partial [Trachymyrmex zeteki]